MSDTPRTDDATIPWHDRSSELDDKVPVSFARQLERELNEQRKINQALALKLNSYESGILVGKGTIPFQ